MLFLSERVGDRVKAVTETVVKLQALGDSLSRMDVDVTEYAYLKVLTLFSPGSFFLHNSAGFIKLSINF